MALALYHLSAEVRDVGILDGLVQVHLRLHVMSVATTTLVQARHLYVLDLGLSNAGAFSGEEFLLLIINHAVLHFVRFGRGTLRFREFLVYHVGLHLRVIVLNTLILSDGHLVRRNFYASTVRMDRLRVFLALVGRRMPLTALDMHDAGRGGNGHLL